MGHRNSIIDQYLPEIVAFRHNLHENPELGYEEFETAKKISKRLEDHGGFDIQSGIAKTGIVVTLGKDKPGKGIALRADMDCLPITEKSGKPWTSKKPGLMHACGHDGHTSMLLGTALTLSHFADSLKGPVKFIFQPAEEGGAGGDKMVTEGVLENPAVEMIFGLHGWPGLKLGEFASCSGSMMANADEFEITILGRGGHAAFPQKCIDPIVIASQVISAIQSISSRSIAPEDAAVVTVAKIEGGTAFNIIPDRVNLLGTIRTLSDETQARIFERLTAITSGVAESMGGKAEIKITKGYPVLRNDPKAYQYVARTLTSADNPLTEVTSLFPQLVGEDFAYFGQKVPACFFVLGLNPEGHTGYPQLHQADFYFNDDAIPIGIDCFTKLALNYWG